jgi:leucyl-tRNA synthetase
VELKGVKVINPFTEKVIPLFASDFVLGHYGTGAIMAVPAHDERDYDFAKKFNLPIIETVKSKGEAAEDAELNKAYVEDGFLVNSNEYDGLTSEEARKRLTQWLEREKIGHGTVNYKLRDWCISRQRYWGPPIPMIHCEKCGAVPVPENELPVLLPKTKDYLPRADGLSPLARNEEFWKTKCPECGGPARRETDVSDTFLDSAWYFFRYPSVEFNDKIFDKERTKKWLPVGMYIGGQEHAVLHLLYSRFIAMFFYDLGLIDFEEPYERFFAHGLLIKEGSKMSKSKGNVINPDEYIQKYGADSVRMYLMFLGEATQGGDWRDAGMAGMFRFINRVWSIAEKIIKKGGKKSQDADVLKIMHKTIKRAGDDLEKLKFNTSIASIMEYVNSLYEFEAAKKDIGVDAVEALAKLLAPLAPHLAEELWSALGNKKSIHMEAWPEYVAALVEEGEYDLIIQINGKMRDKIRVSKKLERPEIEKLTMARDTIKKHINGKEIKKIILVPNRLINIVISQ